jgi:hypothetical protein
MGEIVPDGVYHVPLRAQPARLQTGDTWSRATGPVSPDTSITPAETVFGKRERETHQEFRILLNVYEYSVNLFFALLVFRYVLHVRREPLVKVWPRFAVANSNFVWLGSVVKRLLQHGPHVAVLWELRLPE